jgi:hypothetical protein
MMATDSITLDDNVLGHGERTEGRALAEIERSYNIRRLDDFGGN